MVVKEQFWFEPAGEHRTLHIYLPDGYEGSTERYPVMYFFDGHNLFFNEDATYGKSWGLKEYLDGWKKKMIIVGVECSHHGTDRLSEYCPYPTYMFGENITGEGKQTMNWMVYVLKPYIDRTYRTYAHREATGICGSSMGGLMALYAAVAFNAVFSKAGCISSAIGIVREPLFAEIENAVISSDTRIFLSWGENECGKVPNPEWEGWTAENNRGAAKLLDRKGTVNRLYFQKDGNHCEASWELQLPLFMPFLWE